MMAADVVKNQQLTESLVGTEEKFARLILEHDQLKQCSSGSEVESLKDKVKRIVERRVNKSMSLIMLCGRKTMS